MNKLLWLFVVCVVLVGCSSLGVPAPQEVVADTIEKVDQTSNIINNEIEPWILGVIILLAGWAIPTPGTMIKGLFSFISDIFKMFRR